MSGMKALSPVLLVKLDELRALLQVAFWIQVLRYGRVRIPLVFYLHVDDFRSISKNATPECGLDIDVLNMVSEQL